MSVFYHKNPAHHTAVIGAFSRKNSTIDFKFLAVARFIIQSLENANFHSIEFASFSRFFSCHLLRPVLSNTCGVICSCRNSMTARLQQQQKKHQTPPLDLQNSNVFVQLKGVSCFRFFRFK